MTKTDPKLSIVILNYNTKEITLDCVESVINNTKDINYEIVLIDNNSSDGSQQAFADLEKKHDHITVVVNEKNLGFAKGNNKAKKIVKGKYVLFLNSDTIVPPSTIKNAVDYMDKHPKTGSLTCKIVLPGGELDLDSRRSFPTPWVAFTHFSGMDRLFPNSKLFSKYWYGYIDENTIHEVDVLQGAFHLTRKNLLDRVEWFDEDYFLDGEDIDLSWKIKQAGYNLLYYPEVQITHIKKASKKNKKNTHSLKHIMAGVDSMEIFYRKRLWSRYPLLLNLLVIFGIKAIKVLRVFKAGASK